MGVIGKISIEEFRALVNGFDQKYVGHWDLWLEKSEGAEKSLEFGRILRSWQAFRPNVMRRPICEANHEPPYLEGIIKKSDKCIRALSDFDISGNEPLSSKERKALYDLWNILLQLSFEGKRKTRRNGLAGVVGLSKATLLLTKGRVGPAFDSEVRRKLCLCEPKSSSQWIDALVLVAEDIKAFQEKNKCKLQEAAPDRFAKLYAGRLYDMALGPRGKTHAKRW